MQIAPPVFASMNRRGACWVSCEAMMYAIACAVNENYSQGIPVQTRIGTKRAAFMKEKTFVRSDKEVIKTLTEII